MLSESIHKTLVANADDYGHLVGDMYLWRFERKWINPFESSCNDRFTIRRSAFDFGWHSYLNVDYISQPLPQTWYQRNVPFLLLQNENSEKVEIISPNFSLNKRLCDFIRIMFLQKYVEASSRTITEDRWTSLCANCLFFVHFQCFDFV